VDIEPGQRADPRVVAAVVADRVGAADAGRRAQRGVVLAERRRQVHHAGAVGGGDPRRRQHRHRVGEEAERRPARVAEQGAARHPRARDVAT
jgi:hypothetical protein